MFSYFYSFAVNNPAYHHQIPLICIYDTFVECSIFVYFRCCHQCVLIAGTDVKV